MLHCDEDDVVDAHLIAKCTLLMEEVGIIVRNFGLGLAYRSPDS